MRPHRVIGIQTLSDTETVRAFLAQSEHVRNVLAGPDDGLEQGSLRIEFTGGELDMSALLRRLIEQGFAIASFSEESGNLEDVFMQATKGIVR